MPEGDTIYRAARTLNRALAGKKIVEFESVFPALTRVEVAGRTVERVASEGKHLLMFLSDGLVLRTHMRMNGSWHVYRRGERWQRPRRDMRIRLATADFEAVAFTVHVAEAVKAGELARHDELRRLGPDLLADAFDASEVLRRMRARPGEAIADVLLNQRVLAGIGNVYKSEILFIERVNPFRLVRSLPDDTLESIVATARRLLRVNVSEAVAPMTTYTGYRRTTRRANPAERLWVYGRAGKPCRRCGTPISIEKHGLDARLTYWCEGCQGARC